MNEITFHIMTLFPDMVMQGLGAGVIGRAAERGVISLHAVNIRDYSQDKHGKVDDYPYGGGAGMLMQAQPVFDAWNAVTRGRKLRTVYLTPQGRPFTQKMAEELSKERELVLLCGHYEGIDQRVLEETVTDYVSIGDYVLTGGELAAMVLIDAIARLIPGVLGNEHSAEEESFFNDLLEYPQYSRPEVWHGKRVPEVLLSGDHRRVSQWRLEQSRKRTERTRPDLYAGYDRKQRLIKQLSGDKRNYIHMMESLAGGKGEILYWEGEDILLYDRGGRVCMISASSREAGEEMAALTPEEAEYAVVAQEFISQILCMQGRFKVQKECYQVLYTQKNAMPVKHKNIRKLTPEHLDYVSSHYGCADREYVEGRIRAGAVYGAFGKGSVPEFGGICEKGSVPESEGICGEGSVPESVGICGEGSLLGFAGVRGDGSLEYLYVDEKYRRRGIAASLEAYCVNRILEKGRTPYGYIAAGDDAAFALQDKLGLYRSHRPVWWLERKILPCATEDCRDKIVVSEVPISTDI